MKLTKLLEHVSWKCLQGSVDVEVESVINDSRKVEEGSLFFCIKGAVTDGHRYVPEVLERGAKVLVVQDAVEAPQDVTVIQVEDTRYAMAMISAAWFGYPAQEGHRDHRNKGENDDDIHGQVDPGVCGLQGRTDRDH